MMSGSDLTAEQQATAEMCHKGVGSMGGTDHGTTEMATMLATTLIGMQGAMTDAGKATATGTSASAKRKRTRYCQPSIAWLVLVGIV